MRQAILIIGLFAAFTFAGCGGGGESDPQSVSPPSVEPDPPRPPETAAPTPENGGGPVSLKPNYATVNVFFATDRNRSKSKKPSDMFGVERGSSLTYGTCKVSIPRDHRMGELESPSIWRLEFRQDPEKHVVLLQVSVQQQREFFAEISARVKKSVKKNAFVFVHGYNVSFEDAARRTAQISYDLGFDGAPVFYSWPSQGTVAGYVVDETNIEWAQTNIKRFLDDFAVRSDAENIYLIAHSMGSRGLTRAFTQLVAEKPALRTRFREVILAAPDIDAEVFKRDIAPKLAPATLYASSQDKALELSRKFHGYPRAGDSGARLLIMPGVETIDASNVDSDFLGHSYFGEATSVISDMFYLIKEAKRADARFGLQPVDIPEGRYWVFKQ